MASALVFAASVQCQHCNKEGFCCSMSAGSTSGLIRASFDDRRNHYHSSIRYPFCRKMKWHWLSRENDLTMLNIRVAADEFSESTSDSSEYIARHGYHPLEELKKHERNKDVFLSDAEVARTITEANSKALLVFPGRVHNESHGHVSWAEYRYILDEYGDIFFEFFDDDCILQDPYASNPVTVLIGMDSSICGENRMASRNYDQSLGNNSRYGTLFDYDYDYDYDEIVNTEVNDVLIKWGLPKKMRHIHPIYFSKCIAKSVNTQYVKKMEFPTNGISLVGCLRPAFLDEEFYLRRSFNHEDGDGYFSDWKDDIDKDDEEQVSGTFIIDGEITRFRRKGYISSTIYKFEILSVELFSIYGNQVDVSLKDFQDAEPDLLGNSVSTIVERFNENGMQISVALKSLCRKKKGLVVETANLIGVDSLGMDVRVSSGITAQTLRFSFSSRATSVSAAEKKIRRMLFPRYQRKNSRSPNEVSRT